MQLRGNLGDIQLCLIPKTSSNKLTDSKWVTEGSEATEEIPVMEPLRLISEETDMSWQLHVSYLKPLEFLSERKSLQSDQESNPYVIVYVLLRVCVHDGGFIYIKIQPSSIKNIGRALKISFL